MPEEDGTITLRVRTPSESFTLENLDVTSTVAHLQALIKSRTDIAPHSQIFKIGYPPEILPMPENPFTTEVETLGLEGKVLTIERRSGGESSNGMGRHQMSFPSGKFPVIPSSADSASDFTGASFDGLTADPSSTSHDEELAKAIAISLNDAGPESSREEFEAGPIISDALSDGTYIVRRFVDSDNSCLFTAVAYVMEGNRLKGFDLRTVIAAVVQSDPITYNEAFLGRPNEDYCEWIVNPQHWGGEIELMILSQYYRRQIAAYDIQTTNCYVYGRDAGYRERVMLVYDGIHYDALALSPSGDASEELDLRIFDPESPEGATINEAAVKLVRKFRQTNQFTNTSTFQLRCDDCGRGMTGTTQAIEHQRDTGHTQFSEYK